MKKNNILSQIESLKVEQSMSSLTFSERLARENLWTKTFSTRVISEYKKYIYLVYLSDTEITPSDEVDQAWHLHLTYTKSYWDDLCKEILGFSCITSQQRVELMSRTDINNNIFAHSLCTKKSLMRNHQLIFGRQ